MRISTLFGALVAMLTLSAVAAVTASAAETLWKWLPGSVGETFSGKSGEVIFRLGGGDAFKCRSSKITLSNTELLKEGSSEGKDATLALALIAFEGCSAFGGGISSPGDSPETILVHLEIHNCMIKPGSFGWLIKILPVQFNLLGLEVLLEGAFVAPIEATGSKLSYRLKIRQTGGKPEVEKCEGGEADGLKSKIGTGESLPAAWEIGEVEILFDMTKDKEGEEMMEK